MRQLRERLTRDDILFFLMLIVATAVMSVYYFAHEMSEYNTSLYALSYRYGFISRGLIGSLWQALDAALPMNLMSYNAIFYANVLITGLFFAFIIAFFIYLIGKTPKEYKLYVRCLIIFFMIFTVPMYVTRQNMGRIDIYLIAITILSVWLIVADRGIWLITPLSALAMLIHQGFVFTGINAVLVLLIVRFISSGYKRKYIVVCGITLVVVSALFIYFEFMTGSVSQASFDEMVDAAKHISPNGEYYEMLFKHELLGLDVYEDESFWHLQNRVEAPIFAVLIMPYILLAIRFFRGILGDCETTELRLSYIIVLIGVLTLLPEWVLKVDYGRYVYYTMFYYVIVVVALVCMGDKVIGDNLVALKRHMLVGTPFAALLVIYPILLMPLLDTEISAVTYNILRLIGFRE